MVSDAPVAPTRVRRMPRRPVVGELGHQPALDGLRALAVTAVLLYHARFEFARGGFLGVSTFFTLSGFLITSLLLREWARHGAVDMRRFWTRRFRRLLPASWLTIGLVLAMGTAGIWSTDQLRSLRGDVPWALVELVNWHFIAQDRTYGAAFEAPSPLEHYWSLAIEQQFYLVFPLVVAALLAAGARRARGRRTLRPLVVVLVITVIASAAAAGLVARSSTSTAYFATPTRLAELLIGALLAVVLLQGLRLPGRARNLAVAAGLAGLAGSLVLWTTAGVPDQWLYPWGLLASAVCTAALVTGAVQGGPLTAAFSWAPVVFIGRISYGIYLLHWPVFLWLTPARTGMSQWPLFGLRMAVSTTAAVLMFRVIEHPVRSGARLRGAKAPAALGVSALVLVAGTLVVTRDLPEPRALERVGSGASDVAAAPPAPLRVLLVGDALAAGTEEALDVTDDEVPMAVTEAATPSCGLAVGGYVRLSDGKLERDRDRCGPVRDTWVAAVEAERPDVVAVWGGLRDVSDRRFNAEGAWLAPGDPQLDDFLRGDVGDLLDRLSATGSQVVVLTVPHIRNSEHPPPAPPVPLPPDPREAGLVAASEAVISTGMPPAGFSENDDARIDHWNQILSEVAAERGIPVVDVAARMRGWPGGELDAALRSGGVGLSPKGARELGPWLARTLREARPAPVAAAPAPSVAADAPLPEAPPVTPRRVAPPGRAARILVVGDSVAYNYGYGLGRWADGRRDVVAVNAAQLGCAVARGGSYRYLRDIQGFGPNCEWAETFPRFLADQDPDVVLLSSGIWEVVDRRLPGDNRFRSIGDPGVDRYLLREWLSAVDTLAADGATVVLATYPHFRAGLDQGFSDLPESDPARVDRLNEIIREVASLRPGVTTVLDVQAWLAEQPGGEHDTAKRDDGLHFSDDYAPTIAAWMGPQLLQIARNGPPAG